MGYDKKIVAIVVLVLAGLVIFYAGTRFEKMRINSAQKKSNSATSETKKNKVPKDAPIVAPTDTVSTPIDQPASAVTPAPTKNPTTKTTPAPTK